MNKLYEQIIIENLKKDIKKVKRIKQHNLTDIRDTYSLGDGGIYYEDDSKKYSYEQIIEGKSKNEFIVYTLECYDNITEINIRIRISKEIKQLFEELYEIIV